MPRRALLRDGRQRAAPHRAGHAGRAPRAAGAAGRPASPAIWSSRCARPRSRRASATPSVDAIAIDRRRATKPRPQPAHGLAILVAEDNEINALLARALLARLGHRPTVAPDGAAALEACRAPRAGTPYDLVLMDVHMPRARRHRGDAPHPRRRGRERRAAHADRRAHRQCVRRGPRGLPCRRHGRLPGQAARPRAARRGARRRRAARSPCGAKRGVASSATASSAPLPAPGGSRPSSGSGRRAGASAGCFRAD